MDRDVLLIGSVGLSCAEEVFRTAASTLGSLAPRLPDGETGWARSVWVQCQRPFFLGNPALEMVEYDPQHPGEYRPARVPSVGIYGHTRAETYLGKARPRSGATSVEFDNLGYADWATESYREIARMADTIPNDELAIQWDSTHPVAYESAPPAARETIVADLARLTDHVPTGVELGFHLCYGDFEHKHGLQPPDLSVCVEMAAGIIGAASRPVNYVHMPIPRDRIDAAYVAPLSKLRLTAETRLYLGLVHYTDGVEGTRKRMQVASSVYPEFGIATECGMGRRIGQDIPALLRMHADTLEAN